jgi:hypothetical protein
VSVVLSKRRKKGENLKGGSVRGKRERGDES